MTDVSKQLIDLDWICHQNTLYMKLDSDCHSENIFLYFCKIYRHALKLGIGPDDLFRSALDFDSNAACHTRLRFFNFSTS